MNGTFCGVGALMVSIMIAILGFLGASIWLAVVGSGVLAAFSYCELRRLRTKLRDTRQLDHPRVAIASSLIHGIIAAAFAYGLGVTARALAA